MKRLCLLLAVLMLSGLTGCAKNDHELPQNNSSTEQSVNSSESDREPTQTNSSTEQSVNSSESDREPTQTSLSTVQSVNSSESNHEPMQTNSSTVQPVNSSESNHEPPQTNSSVQQSTASSGNTSNSEPPIVSTEAKPFGEIKIVPSSYNSSASQQGTVETFEYTSGEYKKMAYVYLPFGYDQNGDTRYNILYFMHGGGGNAGQFYNRSYALNDILDHAIENGEIEPLIVVTPTFYAPSDHDTSVSNAAEQVAVFHKEFINDLMPAVEGHYKTYAKTTDPKGLEASRNHRAFGGFSMGSVTTWYQFVNALDYVAYFMPLSGDCWEFGNQGGRSRPHETAEYLGNFTTSSKYGNDFFIYAMTGGSDIAYDAMNNQIGAMRDIAAFKFGTSFDNGNIAFQVLDGATHDYTYYRNYIYTILPYFFENP